MNLVKMVPGDALYLPSGLLHAFLEGIAIEISANSGQCLRGGLTDKHVDIHQLLKTVTFEEKPLSLVRGVEPQKGESVFSTEAKEFELRRFVLRKGESRAVPSSWSSRIFFVASGPAELRVEVDTDQGRATFHRGKLLCPPRRGLRLFIPRKNLSFFRPARRRWTLYMVGDHLLGVRHKRIARSNFGYHGCGSVCERPRFFAHCLEKSGLSVGPIVSIGMDLRPSSPRIAGEAVARAVREEGGSVEYLGRLPSPALMAYGCARNRASVMVTGSHIPFTGTALSLTLPMGKYQKKTSQRSSPTFKTFVRRNTTVLRRIFF